MSKLNNKGMTIVEIVFTFVILMVLVLGMLNLTNEIKISSKEKQYYKELNEFSSLLQSIIQDDLINNKLESVTPLTCSALSGARICYTLKFKTGGDKKILVNNDNGTISYDGKVYTVPMNSYVNNYLNSSYLSYSFNEKLYDEDKGIFVLDFPIYENLYGDGTINHGFKIVHLTDKAYE